MTAQRYQMEGGGIGHAPGPCPWGGEPVPTTREWVGPEAGLDRCLLVPNGIRSPDRPFRNQSPNRLRYPIHCTHNTACNISLNSSKLIILRLQKSDLRRP